MAAVAKKAAEGADLVQQAEKQYALVIIGLNVILSFNLFNFLFFSMKTSLLKWKPDYELAADSYSKAATCFKSAKDLQKAKECLYKAADCYKQARGFFSAAK